MSKLVWVITEDLSHAFLADGFKVKEDGILFVVAAHNSTDREWYIVDCYATVAGAKDKLQAYVNAGRMAVNGQ
jgi:hypothetical protein